MRCDEARPLLSAAFDADPIDATALASARAHAAGCDACAAFERSMTSTRQALQRSVAAAPDVWAGVLATITAAPGTVPASDEDQDRRGETARVVTPLAGRSARTRHLSGWLPAAACLLVGLLLGGALVSNRATPPSAAATIPERVASAQFALTSLTADLSITEHGWHPQVPTRTFNGDLAFSSPEQLSMTLHDTTTYPSSDWAPNHVRVVVRADSWWSSGSRDCPGAVQASCTAAVPRVAAVTSREPFDAGTPAPLDLAVPVGSFDRASQPELLGTRTIDGRDAIGVVTSAAQVQPLLDGLRTAGNLRHFFPTDRVELWLDQQALVPLALRVTAAADADRRTWQVNHGYADEPGAALLDVELQRVAVNQAVGAERFPAPPPGASSRDAGFVGAIDEASRAAQVRPATDPPGLVPSRSGTAGRGTPTEAVVRTWSAGRSWVKVRTSDRWHETRLFGELGTVVRPLTLADGSPAYANGDGSRVAIHGDGVDVAIEGSLPVEQLVQIGSSLGVHGVAVPADWNDAATASIADARRLVPGLLIAPAPVGFVATPAVRTDGNVATLAYVGAGSRAVVLVETPGERLSPPLDMDASGVTVRGLTGRYSPGRGEVEWIEGGVSLSLRSSTLSRGELLAFAKGLAPP